MFSGTIKLINVGLNVVCLFDDVSLIWGRKNYSIRVTPDLNARRLIRLAAGLLVKNLTNLGDFCINRFLIHKRVTSRANL